jgi:hypothetical protein
MTKRKSCSDLWTPSLDDAESCLGSAYAAMPRDPPGAVPWYVRLLENPRSPVALAGAIDLFGHDCIHIVLGRGLTPQDEAFVLGFTMGSSRCPRWQAALFCWCARWLYRGSYRFQPRHCEVYRAAFEAARSGGVKALDGIDFQSWLDVPLGQLRRWLGIAPGWLHSLYAEEARRWPSPSARRLAQPRFGRFTALTLPLRPPPQ